ncbi:MAG: VOC family protein [Pyrinomonadaceae bacterium]
MAKITGIGGVFFKSKGKGSELAEWYKTNLGLDLESWGGAIIKWTDDEVKDGGLTVWISADSDSKWFSPSDSSFMINYRVDNMDELLEQLKQNGIEPVGGPDTAENGKFAWIIDPDGNKVELWEPMNSDEKE